MMLRIAFIMEQHLGHRSFYESIRRFICDFPDINPTWIPITYSLKTSLLENVSFIPEYICRTIAGRREIKKGLGQGGFDALVFNTQVPTVLAGNLLKKQPYLICTDITPVQYDRMAAYYNHRLDRPGLIRMYKHDVNKKVFQQAGHILPWSTWTQQSLIDDYGIAKQRTTVNPPGVDIDLWRPAERPRTGPLRVLFVGGDFYRKGGDTLLQACQKFLENEIELVLVTHSVIAGRDWVKVYNDLEPNSTRLIELYQSADVFVLPTRAEAFGIAVVEACAAGLPAIVTPVGGLTDIVEDGVNGFLVPPDQPEYVRECLAKLAKDPDLRHRMGMASRQKAIVKFNARSNVANLVKNLYEILGRVPPERANVS